MAKAKTGDIVRVHYTGKLDDGTVFDSSADHPPLELVLGNDRVIPSVEQALLGMSPGDSKTIVVPADRAYGPHDRELVMTLDREQLPDSVQPEPGQMLQMTQRDGRVIRFTVVDMSETTLTVDANHPLAGQDLSFDLELVEIV